MSPPRSALVRNLLGAMTLMGAAGSASVYFSVGRERFWVNWLVWTLFLLTLGLGNLFLVALERLVGAHWSVPMRRVPERLASLIPLAVPLLLIAFFGVPVIFPWTYPEAAHNPGRQSAVAEPPLLCYSPGRLCHGVDAFLRLLRARLASSG